jgi:heavy metal sensor kinase
VALSIRWRLTLWNTLALAVVLLGFAALVYGLLAHTLYQQVDRKLLSGFHELRHDTRLAADPEGQMRHWAYELFEHEGIFAVVYDTGGDVVLRTEELAEAAVPLPPAAAEGDPRLREAVVPIIGRQRVLEGQIRLGGREVRILLMTPLEEVDRELGRLLTVLGMAVPVALACSAGLGYLLARKALKPVDQLRRSTREITAERLDRRLPVASAGDEIGRLAGTINEMIGRLERSFAEVRRFTADASHELRSPLAVIRTEAEVALGGPSVTAEQQRLLGSILEECARLTRLTDQLLTLSREDAVAAQLPREPVDLAALVGGVVDNMRPLADVKGVTLHAGGAKPLWVGGDAARLRQVFYNLLDNAIKYTPEGGTVKVSVTARTAGAVVTVSDTGIAIPPEHLPHVFARFYRVDKARTRAEGGTGLGLSIARSIVLAHGGEIELASTPGQGTVCTVTLPGELDDS